MREHLPKKEIGDQLTTTFINRVGTVCNRYAQQPNIDPKNTGQFYQRTFEITNTKISEDDDDDSGLYFGKKLRFITENLSWQMEDKEWIIDDAGIGLNLSIGDRIVCFWEANRSLYIAIGTLGLTLSKYFELKTELLPGETATAYLRGYANGAWTTSFEEEDEFIVTDLLSEYWGRARDAFTSPNERGSYGMAAYNSDSESWEIREIEPHALTIRGTATEIDVSNNSSDYDVFTITDVKTMQPTGAIRIDADPDGDTDITNPGDLVIAEDDFIVAEWDEPTVAWIAIGIIPASGKRRFELKDDLAPGETVTAYLQEWDGDSWEASFDFDKEFEVSDVLSIFRGRKNGLYSSPHDKGSSGKASYNSDSEQWEIDELTPHALWLTGAVVSAFATTDATFEIDGTKKMFPTGSFIVNTDPAANITVHNIHDWDADENALAEVRWNEDSTRWECVDVDCTA